MSIATPQTMEDTRPPVAPRKKKSSFVWRVIQRSLLGLFVAGSAYALAAYVLSRIPLNGDFVQPDDGVEIAVISNGVHIDLALPLRNGHYDWMEHFREDDVRNFQPDAQLAIFGWGERTFYLETPTWGEVKPLNVLRAFCGAGRPVMHVDLAAWRPTADDSCRLIKFSPAQYRTLCDEILSTIQIDETRRAKPIAGAHYHETDAFYEAHGVYHLFHTCNAWAGDSLRASGVRMGVWTPTTGGVFACLPPNSPNK